MSCSACTFAINNSDLYANCLLLMFMCWLYNIIIVKTWKWSYNWIMSSILRSVRSLLSIWKVVDYIFQSSKYITLPTLGCKFSMINSNDTKSFLFTYLLILNVPTINCCIRWISYSNRTVIHEIEWYKLSTGIMAEKICDHVYFSTEEWCLPYDYRCSGL